MENENLTHELLGIKMTFEEFDRFICEQNKGKQLKVVDGKVVAEEYVPTQEEINNAEIAKLKAELATYDYIGTKIAMGVATKEDYTEQIAYTETLRDKIRQLGG